MKLHAKTKKNSNFAMYFQRIGMRKGLFICILSSILLIACSKSQGDQQAEMTIDTIPQLVTQIQKTSKLYTSEYRVHKIITHDDELQLKGSFMKQDFEITLPAGKRKVAIPIDATLKAYIDFANFSEKNIRREGRKITIILPDPVIEVTSTKINHQDIKQYVALTRENFSDEELADYEQQGRASIVNSIPKADLTENARASATHVIIPIIMQMGFKDKDITVEFSKDYDQTILQAPRPKR